MRLLLIIILASGCRGSGVPWRRVEATLARGARIEIGVKASVVGTAEASVRVESGAEGTAQVVFDRTAEEGRHP